MSNNGSLRRNSSRIRQREKDSGRSWCGPGQVNLQPTPGPGQGQQGFGTGFADPLQTPQELFQLQEKKNHIPQKSHFSGHALNTATLRAEKVKQGLWQEMAVLLECVILIICQMERGLSWNTPPL